jgi:hypothetical protein
VHRSQSSRGQLAPGVPHSSHLLFIVFPFVVLAYVYVLLVSSWLALSYFIAFYNLGRYQVIPEGLDGLNLWAIEVVNASHILVLYFSDLV